MSFLTTTQWSSNLCFFVGEYFSSNWKFSWNWRKSLKNARRSQDTFWHFFFHQSIHSAVKWKIYSQWNFFFRQINYLAISLVKVLLSRKFCQKSVRVNFCKNHTVLCTIFRFTKYLGNAKFSPNRFRRSVFKWNIFLTIWWFFDVSSYDWFEEISYDMALRIDVHFYDDTFLKIFTNRISWGQFHFTLSTSKLNAISSCIFEIENENIVFIYFF